MNNRLSLRIRGLASQEYTIEQIAKRLKITKGEAEYYVSEMGYRPRYDTPGKIMRYQAEHGVPMIRPDMVSEADEHKEWKLTEKDIKRIKALHEEGFTVTDIALRVGKHRDTVRNALKRIGSGKG